MLPAREFQHSALVLGVKVQGYALPVARLVEDVLNDSDWNRHGTPQHLYLLFDGSYSDGLKYGGDFYVGDYAFDTYNGKIRVIADTHAITAYDKKIIASTDPKLYVSGKTGKQYLPWIPKSFVEKYVNKYNSGKVITEVSIRYEEFAVSNRDMEKLGRRLLVDNSANTVIIRDIKNKWNREEVEKLLIMCCGEVSCEDGILVGKHPADLVKWIEENV